jgi:hypothetical protein
MEDNEAAPQPAIYPVVALLALASGIGGVASQGAEAKHPAISRFPEPQPDQVAAFVFWGGRRGMNEWQFKDRRWIRQRVRGE